MPTSYRTLEDREIKRYPREQPVQAPRKSKNSSAYFPPGCMYPLLALVLVNQIFLLFALITYLTQVR